MTSFSDDFNRADSTNLGVGWVEVSGNWSITSNQLSPGSAGGTIILRAAGAMDSDDHYTEATITATSAATHGVWCRGNSNISSGYLWRNDGSSWDLFAVVGGSFIVIGTYAVAASPGDVARVQAVGSTITGWVNGVERVSVTDTDVPTGTSVGVRSESTSSIRFDDFTAADVTSAVVLGTATETDAAQPLAGAKTAVVGVAASTDAARPLAAGKATALGTAGTSGAAQALTAARTAALGPAAATEGAQPLTATKSATLGTAGEIDAARPLTTPDSATLGTASEQDTAQALAASKTAAISPAVETHTARPLTASKRVTLGVATETDTARPLTTPVVIDDVEILVGAPHGTWTVGEPYATPWTADAPHGAGWEVAAPA